MRYLKFIGLFICLINARFASSQIKKSIVFKDGFDNTNVEIIVDNSVIYKSRLTTNESVGVADVFLLKKKLVGFYIKIENKLYWFNVESRVNHLIISVTTVNGFLEIDDFRLSKRKPSFY